MGWVGNIAEAVGGAFGSAIAGLLLGIAGGILWVSTTLLNATIDPSFIHVPYTSGVVIDAAWPVVRDFANMLLVLILVVIALGTALRLGEYEAKKTLPRLIGIALLINFTPVLAGFVVDAANLVMRFFLEGAVGAGVINSNFQNLTSILINERPFGGFDPAGALGFLTKLVLLVAFELFAAYVFFRFGWILLKRRVWIWILVILSPLAFMAFILPATQKYWSQWWSKFFEQAFIGVPIAFFLWLGDHIIALALQGGLTSQPSGNFIEVLLAQVLPFAIALLVLAIGSQMAGGTSGVIGAGALGLGAIAGGAVGGRVLGYAQSRGQKMKEGILRSKAIRGIPGSDVPKEQGLAYKMAGAELKPGWGKDKETGADVKTAGGWLRRRGAQVAGLAAAPVTAGVRKLGRALGPGEVAEEKRRIKELTQKYKAMEPQERLSIMQGGGPMTERIAAMHATITEKDTDETIRRGLTKDTMEDIRDAAVQYDEQQEIDTALPFLMKPDDKEMQVRAERNLLKKDPSRDFKTNALTDDEYKANYQDWIAELFKFHPERAEWISGTALERLKKDKKDPKTGAVITPAEDPATKTRTFENPDLLDAMLKGWDARQMGTFIAKNQGKAGVEALEDRLAQTTKNTNPDDWAKWLRDNNSSLYGYMTNIAGTEGFRMRKLPAEPSPPEPEPLYTPPPRGPRRSP